MLPRFKCNLRNTYRNQIFVRIHPYTFDSMTIDNEITYNRVRCKMNNNNNNMNKKQQKDSTNAFWVEKPTKIKTDSILIREFIVNLNMCEMAEVLYSLANAACTSIKWRNGVKNKMNNSCTPQSRLLWEIRVLLFNARSFFSAVDVVVVWLPFLFCLLDVNNLLTL